MDLLGFEYRSPRDSNPNGFRSSDPARDTDSFCARDMIAAHLHSHLTETSCLEVMVVKGPSKRLKGLIDGLKANKPVKQIKFSVMSTNER